MKFPGKALHPLFMMCLFVFIAPVHSAAAQEPAVAVGVESATQVSPDATTTPEAEKKYYYEQTTRQKFSRLFWALDFLDINNDEDIDNYLMFNECEIYKSEFFNELEWKDIRESARVFLKENKDTFPIRFEVIQPLFLGEYDVNTKKFEVLDKYKIRPTTRLEIMATDHDVAPCLESNSSKTPRVPRYPPGILAEFNLPLEATQIPVDPAVAELYIKEKADPLRQKSAQNNKDMTQNALFNARDAYIFIRVKFFAAKGIVRQRGEGERANILTILEGVEVYADRDKKMLLWKKDFRKKRSGASKQAQENSASDATETESGNTVPAETPQTQ